MEVSVSQTTGAAFLPLRLCAMFFQVFVITCLPFLLRGNTCHDRVELFCRVRVLSIPFSIGVLLIATQAFTCRKHSFLGQSRVPLLSHLLQRFLLVQLHLQSTCLYGSLKTFNSYYGYHMYNTFLSGVRMCAPFFQLLPVFRALHIFHLSSALYRQQSSRYQVLISIK